MISVSTPIVSFLMDDASNDFAGWRGRRAPSSTPRTSAASCATSAGPTHPHTCSASSPSATAAARPTCSSSASSSCATWPTSPPAGPRTSTPSSGASTPPSNPTPTGQFVSSVKRFSCHHLRRTLLSMRSDRARASRLYHRVKPMAVEVILNMAAKCPELKAKAQLPPTSYHLVLAQRCISMSCQRWCRAICAAMA
ncbi:hypothetical protein PAHAL_3G164700 [Panicum hallii]|uniref:Uncharacterized protein n=1 Tax=Panicum hallii TaxID=206008 RepID=A0A2T8KIH2_9POAL|nr:uncharacterized protein LOC112886812 isoform X1 [Panicum hallii]PVH61961.1 hypothetical protein PAHAL_3G164700 [Panicum hallii]